MEIKDRGLNEKINQLKKGLEIVGGKSNLSSEDNSEILNYIIDTAFSDGMVKFNINNIEYSINEKTYDSLINYALSIGVKNGFIQESGTSSEEFVPNFNNEGV